MFRRIPIRLPHFAVALGLVIVIVIVYPQVFAVNQTTLAMTFLLVIFEARPKTQSYRRPNYRVAGVLEPTDEFELMAPFGPAGGVPL